MVKKQEKTATVKAKARMLRTSPRKLNLVAASIRGLKVNKALSELAFSPKRISTEVRKVLLSAIANAENNHGMNIDTLVVAEAYVGKALVMKRFMTRAKGSASRILKPFSNLTIVVAEAKKEEKKSGKKGADKAAKAEPKAQEKKENA